MTTAFGLDLAGYAGGNTGFARADHRPREAITVTIYRDHTFARRMKGSQVLTDMLNLERKIIGACLRRGSLVVDVPIDLQGLPNVNPVHYTWEQTRRPVDFALTAMPALADRIGAPTARFLHYFAGPNGSHEHYGKNLWETYPAASLRRLGCKPTERDFCVRSVARCRTRRDGSRQATRRVRMER